jgi:23S rRNA (adenine2030-N6)-methyltransferase
MVPNLILSGLGTTAVWPLRLATGIRSDRRTDMNYRHAFHAGNFAEIVKHAVFARVIAQLRQKPTAFRILDTHAGPGATDLTGPQATRTGEWQGGIGRLLGACLADPVRQLLAPYLDVVAALNPGGPVTTYPGSPALAQAWLRRDDRLIACELEPGTMAQLAKQLRGDRRAKAIAIDGWTALGAYLPPPERRGVVLIDPPFEAQGEFGRLAEGLRRAHRKWPTGIYLLWYPIKEPAAVETFATTIVRMGIAKILRAELMIGPAGGDGLAGTGLMLVNPPWALEGELAVLLPALAGALADDHHGQVRLDWIAGEK